MSGSREELPDWLSEENKEAIRELNNSSGSDSDSSGTSGSSGSTDSGGTTSSASGFADELGGDPAGDSDRTVDSTPSTEPDSSSGSTSGSSAGSSTGETSATDFGEELGGDPAGDADRTVDSTPTDSDSSSGQSGSEPTASDGSTQDVNVGTGSGGELQAGTDPTVNEPSSETSTGGESTSGQQSSSSQSSGPGSGSDESSSSSGSIDPSEDFTTENRSAVAEMEGRAPGGGVQVEDGVELSDRELRETVARETDGVGSGDLEVLEASDGRVVVFEDETGGGAEFADTSGTGFGGGSPDAGGRATLPAAFANTSQTGFGGTPNTPSEAEAPGEAAGSFPGVSSGSEGLNLLEPSEEERARENAVEDINEELDEQGSTVDVTESDLNVVQAGGEAVVTLDEETQRALAREDIRNQLSEETGVDLGSGDITVEETGDGRFQGELSESGRDRVEVENTPLADVPVLGGVTTTGTRARQGLRDVTDPVAEPVNNALPEADSVLGLLGAAAPAAAAEPTLTGEAALGGAALLGGALVVGSGSAGAVTGDDPQAGTEVNIPERSNTELTVPEESSGGELEPGDGQLEEISVPEGSEQRLGPDELGVPEDELQERELVGPEGTEINEDGDLVIPAEAGGVVITRDTRQDEEEEDEDEEDDEDDEEEEEEEPQSREEFLEEISPDETVVIGEPTGEASESESAGESETDQSGLFEDIGEETQSDDAEPDETEADETDPLDDVGVDEGTLSDDAEPDDTTADETDPLEDVGEDLVDPGSDGAAGGSSPSIVGIGPSGPLLIGGLVGSQDEAEVQEPGAETDVGQSPLLDELEDSQQSEAVDTDFEGAQQPQTPTLESEAATSSLLSGQLSAPGLASLFGEATATETTPSEQVANETVFEEQFERGVSEGGGSGQSSSRLRLLGGDPELREEGDEPDPDSETSASDGSLTSGYFNEFTSQLAGVDRSAPDEETLEDIVEERTTTEALPTEGELEESEEFGEAAGFLSGEGTGVELDFSFEFGDDSDDGGFNLL